MIKISVCNRNPIRTSETAQEYPKMSKDRRSNLKDIGGLVGGWLRGGTRKNGNRQYLVTTNIGRKSWVDWMDFVEGVSDELPDLIMLSDIEKDPPKPPEELITGILRRGHKMLISGSSKAGKSFLLSGVFARDPDAQLDMIQLDLNDDIKNYVREGNSTAWRLESSLREFENITPVNFWFEYPIHRMDSTGNLSVAPTEGSFEAVRSKNRKCTTSDERRQSIEAAFQACSYETPVTMSAMADYLGVSERCVRDRLKELKDVYWCKGGTVGKVEKTEN